VEENPEVGYLKIQELNLSCIIWPQGDHRDIVTELDGLLGEVDFTYSAGTMFSDLITTVTRIDCHEVDADTVRKLAGTLADNPRYRNDVGYRQLNQQLLARLSRDEGDFDQTLRHLGKAIEIKPSSDLNMMTVTTLVDAKDFDGARTFIERARRNHPSNPLRRFAWQNQLDELGRYIEESERHHDSEPALH
jgi:tetratricopeptide (TPR) repeat protein